MNKNENINKFIEQAVIADHEYVVSLRRHFHKHPELSLHEYETCLKIEEELDKLNIEHYRIGNTSVVGILKGSLKGNKTLALRADIDALPILETHECEYTSVNPGVMHACGHDGHTAGLIGTARILANNRDLFGGTIKFIFQCAEEVGKGGAQIAKSNVLDDVDRCFGIHLSPIIKVGDIALIEGPNKASVDWFNIHVEGLASHVSTPQKGVDAAFIGAAILVNLQALVTRRTSPMANVLIGVGKFNAGTAYNVLASSADLEGTIRSLDPALRQQVKEELKQLVENTASIYGGKASIEYDEHTDVLINPPVIKEAIEIAQEIFGKEHVIIKREPSLGGDDMAEIIKKVNGSYGYVGCANEQMPGTNHALHTSNFDMDEECLKMVCQIEVTYAIAYLNGRFD